MIIGLVGDGNRVLCFKQGEEQQSSNLLVFPITDETHIRELSQASEFELINFESDETNVYKWKLKARNAKLKSE